MNSPPRVLSSTTVLVFPPPSSITVCFVNLVRTKGRLLHSQRMHLLLQRCSGRVRPASAHNAHDTMLSDANARDRRSRRDTKGVAVAIAGPCTESSQKRAGRTVTFVSAEAVARRLEFVVPARTHLRGLVFIQQERQAAVTKLP